MERFRTWLTGATLAAAAVRLLLVVGASVAAGGDLSAAILGGLALVAGEAQPVEG